MMLPLPWACMARTSCFMLRTTPRIVVANSAAKHSIGGGVVHGDIETPKPRDGLVDHIADVTLLANVGVDELGFRAESAQLLNERLAGRITPTGNDHLRALLGEGNGSGAPDAGQSTGDQNDLSAHGSSPSRYGLRARKIWPPREVRQE